MPATDSLDKVFQNPPAAFRGKPLWCWNSRLSERELLRQVGVLAEMGMGGYFMHSRVGLATKYLGREWFRLIRACAKEGKRLGLESWLYDEDRWPSGSAGGLVTRNPEFRMRYLRCEVAPREEAPLNGGSVIAIFAATLDGLSLQNYRRLASTSEKLERGECVVRFSVELVKPHGFFNDGTYLDTLNPRAVRRFLQLTHERYHANCGRMFGGAIPGIFTDEPHRGFVMSDTPEGWTYPVQSRWVTPWTGTFAAHFQSKFHYDLRQRLPELFFQWKGERISPVKWHYMEALHGLFLQSWAKMCHEWCERNNLRLTGHMLGEESPGAQAITCGSAMRYYEHLETPGMDLLGRNNRAFWIAKQVQSVARQLGRKWTMSELYGCTGWQTNFSDHKEIGDWQAFHGINLRSHHLSWFTMAGEAKRDFPASIFFQSNWYREYKAVEDYYARLHLLLQQGDSVCDVLVLHPGESIWAQVHAGWGGWIKSLSKAAVRIDRDFEKVFRWITAARIDFDYGDEEQLGRLGGVEKRGAEPRLRLGRGAYRAVLVCGMETMRGSTLRLLEKFSVAGGHVIFSGPPPSHVDAVKFTEPRQLRSRATSVPFARKALVEALRRAAPPMATLEGAEPRDISRPVLLQTRRQGENWIVAVCNTDPGVSFSSAKITFEGQGAQIQEWNCRTGERCVVPHKKSAGILQWDCSLPTLGERVFRIVPSSVAKAPEAPPKSRRKFRAINGPFSYCLDEPNALVLDRFQWKMGQGKWQAEEDILSIDRKMRERCGLQQRSLGMVQPWARRGHSSNGGKPLALRARFTAREIFALTLLVEQPGRWRVTLNGVDLNMSRSRGWFIDPCFRKVMIPQGAVKKGENVITLSAAFREDLDLEAVYLLGEFGVYGVAAGKPALDRLPDRLEAGDVCSQGLPYYSGRVTYQIPLPGCGGLFRLPSFGGAVASVDAADERRILAFPPFEMGLPARARTAECSIVLTRRNLFGPLHWKIGDKDFVAPASFRTVGDAYSVVPLHEPSGLLKAPEISHT